MLRMTFTNSVMIPRKDITIKNHEDSTQLKCKANIKPDNAKTNFRTPGLWEWTQSRGQVFKHLRHTETSELL